MLIVITLYNSYIRETWLNELIVMSNGKTYWQAALRLTTRTWTIFQKSDEDVDITRGSVYINS